MNSQPPTVPELGVADCGFWIYCWKSNESERVLLLLCWFPFSRHLWESRKPRPDTDVISLIESVRDTMQLCFSRSVAPTSDFSSVVIRLTGSQKSHGVVLCSCNVGARQAGIQRSRSRATHQPADFLSPGQMECNTQQMLNLVCYL